MLVHFVAVVQYGSFSAAAAELGVSQPTVSRSINRLETSLGALLLDRSPQGATLLPAGRRILDLAEEILADTRAIRDRLTSVSTLRAGSLRIAVAQSLVIHPMADVIKELSVTAPGVLVKLVNAESPERVADLVRSGQCEVGLADGETSAAGTVSRRIGDRRVVLAGFPGDDWPYGRGRRLPFEAIDAVPLITGPMNGAMERLVRDSLSRPPARVAVRCGSWRAVWDLVALGVGCALLPEALVRTELDGVPYWKFEPELTLTEHLIVRRGSISPAATLFVRLIENANAGRDELPGDG
ncbi:hypothetical protein BHE97_17760 [Aeromicrobium sp. PE09-221]|nr:hypothetical protein BHE97_17760 [Aeromicrobium sp. PE09-221]